MAFVAEHPDHPDVCNWCHANTQPKNVWQWNPAEGVWYKWDNGRWNYWGPSKEGMKHEWSYYNGYWHHGGYVFKYDGGKWHRFQGGKWVEYGTKIDIDPVPPYTKDCRSFRKLALAHVPDSLTEHEIPRCQVGEGAEKTVWEWTGDEDCAFLQGTKVFQKNFKCKDGS